MEKFTEYLKSAKNKYPFLKSNSSTITIGTAFELLAYDWLEKRGWKVIRPNTIKRKLEFFELLKRNKIPVTKKQLRFMKTNPLFGLVGDGYLIKNKQFFILEVKGTRKEDDRHAYSSGGDQAWFYRESYKSGIPIMFVFVKAPNNKLEYLKLCRYPNELIVAKSRVKPKN